MIKTAVLSGERSMFALRVKFVRREVVSAYRYALPARFRAVKFAIIRGQLGWMIIQNALLAKFVRRAAALIIAKTSARLRAPSNARAMAGKPAEITIPTNAGSGRQSPFAARIKFAAADYA